MRQGYYTTLDLIKRTGLSKDALFNRANKLNIPLRLIDNYRAYTAIEANAVINYKSKVFDPEIIYVTRTTEILHSKLNFLTLEQL